MKKILLFIFAITISFAIEACSSGVSSSYTKTTETPSKATYSSSYGSSTFTNKYGTSTTKCAHSGCNNYIASSGDTNCCTTHSKKCLKCKKYIDEDAMYCMSCLTESVDKNSSSSSSSEKCHYKQGGKEVCNNKCQSGSNFCSYHTKYLNDAYNSLIGK